MGGMTLVRVLVITCEMFFRYHLSNTSSISLIGSGKGTFDGLGDTLYSFGSLYAPVLVLLFCLII